MRVTGCGTCAVLDGVTYEAEPNATAWDAAIIDGWYGDVDIDQLTDVREYVEELDFADFGNPRSPRPRRFTGWIDAVTWILTQDGTRAFVARTGADAQREMTS